MSSGTPGELHLPKLIASLLNDQGYSRTAGGWLTATPVANQVELLTVEDEDTPIKGYLITVTEVSGEVN